MPTINPKILEADKVFDKALSQSVQDTNVSEEAIRDTFNETVAQARGAYSGRVLILGLSQADNMHREDIDRALKIREEAQEQVFRIMMENFDLLNKAYYEAVGEAQDDNRG